MRARELFEAPPEIIQPTNFGWDDDDANRTLAQRLLRRKQEILEDHPDYELFLTGDKINGYIAMYLKKLGLLGYAINYKVERRRLLGSTVTQVKLWRRAGTPYVPGITRRVFFDHLLTRWPMVMSDEQQTPEGARFWSDRLAEASTGAYDVGFVDFGRNYVEWWDHTTPITDWIKQKQAWGQHHRFRSLRYLIKQC
jgi:hypothetical protein